MGVVVRHLSIVNGRYKFRVVIPTRLRPFIQGNITKFVRWLGKADSKSIPPEVASAHAAALEEHQRLVQQAENRASNRFDNIDSRQIEYIIAAARAELYAEDEEERFEQDGDRVFVSVSEQLSDAGLTAAINSDADRRFNKRQETMEEVLLDLQSGLARGRISDFAREEVIDRCNGMGLNLDTASNDFNALVLAYHKLLIEVYEMSLARQHGKVVVNPVPQAAPTLKSAAGITLTELAERWWKENERAGKSRSTCETYRRVMRQLSAFLKHNDARAVTKADVVRFKDFRLEQGVNPRTINAGDLSAISALYTWGMKNLHVEENPAKDVKAAEGKRKKVRSSSFTTDEALSILRHASTHVPDDREGAKRSAAKRWVPWLLAYTGARLGEMVQLRTQDVVQKEGRWTLCISPEAGTVKNGHYREVPIHPHLIEMGFTAFVRTQPTGHLFLSPASKSSDDIYRNLGTVKNRITEFVREVVTDAEVQPNHAWRHLFETRSRSLAIREDVTKTIIGHALPDISGDYGEVTLDTLADAIAKFPRYEI